MTASYRKIDYRIRPAKHVERLMMCEAFRRLKFGKVEDYHYIGLGSVYFSDFSLFHKALGIRRMTSIESQEHDKNRFIANLPFGNINMLWGKTSSVLPGVDFSGRSIVWLDYDGKLEKSMLDDLRSVILRIPTGSVFAVSVQCQPPKYDVTVPRQAVTELATQIGEGRVDPAWNDEALIGWGCAKIVKKILEHELAAVLQQRNGALGLGHRFQSEQIMNFHYSDGANMLTVAWVIFDEGQRPLFNSCDFDGLNFARKSDDAFKIDIPKLTSLEIKQLLRQLPADDNNTLNLNSIPQADADNFIKIYRYFPNVAFVDL